MKPNLIIQVTPVDGSGNWFIFDVIEDGGQFADYFRDVDVEIYELIERMGLKRRKNHYFLQFIDAKLVKEAETDSDGRDTGYWWNYLDYKSVEVVAVKPETCQACNERRGLVYVIYEARYLCLECASIWRKEKEEKKDGFKKTS